MVNDDMVQNEAHLPSHLFIIVEVGIKHIKEVKLLRKYRNVPNIPNILLTVYNYYYQKN